MWDDFEMEFTIGGGVIGYKGGFEKLVGLGSASKNWVGASTEGLFRWEFVLGAVCVESSESLCGELDEKPNVCIAHEILIPWRKKGEIFKNQKLREQMIFFFVFSNYFPTRKAKYKET